MLALLLSLAVAAAPLGQGADPAAVRTIEAALEQAPRRLQELASAPLEVLRVERPYDGEPGGSARVVILDTDRGRLLAKISYARPVASRMVGYILQDEASRAGIAPRIHKTIEGDALAALFREHEVLRRMTSPWAHLPDSAPLSMVVMDLVEDGFNFMQHARSHRQLGAYPASMRPRWTQRLRDIATYFDRHNVQMADAQFLIQPDGNCMVIDFDHYTFVDTRGRRWAYAGIADYPDVSYWKTPRPDRMLNDVAPIIRTLDETFAPSR